MYYLNDKHPKYEFTIYIRQGTAIPYLINTYNSYYDAKRFLEEKAKRHQHYNQIFYIDEDFFENEYTNNYQGTYYKILKRPVADWEEIEKEVA